MEHLDKIQGQQDKIKTLSHSEIQKQKKSRVERLRRDFNLPHGINDEQVLNMENKLNDINLEALQETEDEAVMYEGNIAEKLITATERSSDSQLSSVLNKIQDYHQNSAQDFSKKISRIKDKKIKSLFDSQ